MVAMDARERFALISENLAEILNPELIGHVLAEGRNPRIYWGTLHDFPLQLSNSMLTAVFYSARDGYDRTPSLRILCPGPENCTIARCRLRRCDTASRYPWISRQSQGAHRIG
jgi:hypothetical protein